MSLKSIKAFLEKMQEEPDIREKVMKCSTADDVAQIASQLGHQFSGDELLRFSGKKVGSVTVKKRDVPGEYN